MVSKLAIAIEGAIKLVLKENKVLLIKTFVLNLYKFLH